MCDFQGREIEGEAAVTVFAGTFAFGTVNL